MVRLPVILFIALFFSGAYFESIVSAQTPRVESPFVEARRLDPPPVREGFTFAILGDRTSGPESGLAILEQAVRDLNHLDPVLVMTVGDQINGYCSSEEWIAQMEQYRAIMSKLRMPWYPTAGNHDVYGPAGNRNDRTNEALYQQYFGPLYYSFDYQQTHFIVLYSDENLSYRNPAQDQRISEEQLDWLRNDLSATDSSKVFVFLHHPRWNYEGDVWEPVHQTLVRSGKVEAVFAGHWHRYRYDGEQNGIRYYCLATTGGLQGDMANAGYFHHFDLITVRNDSWTMAVIPVGAVLEPEFVTGQESDDVRRLCEDDFLTLVDPFPGPISSAVKADLNALISNPTEKSIEFNLFWSGLPDAGWQVIPESCRVGLDPGSEKTVTFSLQGCPPEPDTPLAPIYLEADAVYPLESGRNQPVHTVCPLDYDLPDMPLSLVQEVAGPEKDLALFLDGEDDCLLVKSTDALNPADAFTLECWAKLKPPAEQAALMAKTQNSSYGFWLADHEGKGPAFSVYLEPGGYASPTGEKEDLVYDAWAHYAGVFDGSILRIYVNGLCIAAEEGRGVVRGNDLPFYVGADVDRGGRPTAFARGLVDEVRLSIGARYTESFVPDKRFKSDSNTVLLLHFDRVFGDLTPDGSGRGHHGRFLSGACLKEAGRKGLK
ncbi:MAG: metallophosphoesterase [Planctomycetes bacterium]|nr:metallophosphoesterase [Planctomycetota bacterium]